MSPSLNDNTGPVATWPYSQPMEPIPEEAEGEFGGSKASQSLLLRNTRYLGTYSVVAVATSSGNNVVTHRVHVSPDSKGLPESSMSPTPGSPSGTTRKIESRQRFHEIHKSEKVDTLVR